MTRFGEPGLASAMGTVYLIAMLLIAIVAIVAHLATGTEPA